MTRLLYLTPGCFDKGGISRYSRYEISAYRELLGESNVRVLSLLGPDESSFEEAFEVDWHGRGRDAISKAGFVGRAVAAALTWRPDVIHVAHLHYSHLALALGRLCRSYSVVNVYGLEVWTDPRRANLWGLRGVDLAVSDCHFTADYLRHEKLREKSVMVVWDCVDTSRFTPGAAKSDVFDTYDIPRRDDGVNLLTLGRMTRDDRHKGFERLLEAFALVASRVPRLRLIYAGRGDLRDELRRRADDLGVSGRVYFTGSVDERDLPEIYRAAHFFALVSDRGPGRGEGIPLTPLEAAACGLPIIVGNHDGSQEAVEEGINGFVVDPHNIELLAQRILELATREETRTRMAKAGVEKVLRDFDYSRFRSKHEELLRELCRG